MHSCDWGNFFTAHHALDSIPLALCIEKSLIHSTDTRGVLDTLSHPLITLKGSKFWTLLLQYQLQTSRE